MSYAGYLTGVAVPCHEGEMRTPNSTSTVIGRVMTTNDLKLHLRVYTTDEDALIESYTDAAQRWFEERTRRSIFVTEWDFYLDEFPCDDTPIRLSRSPVRSVTSIVAFTDTGGMETMSTSDYLVDTASEPGRVSVVNAGSWPFTARRMQAGRIRFLAGYGASSTDVPESLKQIVRNLVAHWFEGRSPVAQTGAVPQDIPYTLEDLLTEYELPEWG